jgi:predicted short-subunit dehydrogenase-like oxidoreductase (DUF2520 family)
VAKAAGAKTPELMRICIIGSGNVGTRLGHAFFEAGHVITGVYSRDLARAETLGAAIEAPATNHFDSLSTACDVVVLAVYDDAIETVFKACTGMFPTQLILHTAGSVPVSVFHQREKCGVLWPVQTLSLTHEISMRTVPVAVTGNSDQSGEEVEVLARSISDQVFRMSDNERLTIHLCATFANNFSNHMYVIAEQILARKQIPFEILLPIIRETADKIQRMRPMEAQTGAAIRGDRSTIEKHLKLLQQDPELADLYVKLSGSIRRMPK